MRLLGVLLLTATYMVAEVVGGLMSNSLSLLADGGHMLADVAALSISLFAVKIAAKPADARATYGYYRAEIVAALLNGVVLLVVAFFIFKEAVGRFGQPQEIDAPLMMGVALGGLVVNIIGLAFLHRHKDENLNIRGAWLHVASDTVGSIGVVISSIFIELFDITIADTIMSITLTALIAYAALQLILETLNVLMEHTPKHIDAKVVQEQMLAIHGVKLVHDLHIWSITSGREALSAHVIVSDNVDHEAILAEIQAKLIKDFGITHCTIQIERNCNDKTDIC